MTDIFKFSVGLRGFHVSSNTVIQKAYIGHGISLKRKHNAASDRFAVAIIFLLKEGIRAATVGHISRGLSQYTWCDIQEGAKFRATVHDTKAKSQPLMQVKLGVQIKVKIVWPQEKSFRY